MKHGTSMKRPVDTALVVVDPPIANPLVANPPIVSPPDPQVADSPDLDSELRVRNQTNDPQHATMIRPKHRPSPLGCEE